MELGHARREQREDVRFLNRVVRVEVFGEGDGLGEELLWGEALRAAGGGGCGVQEGPGLAEVLVLVFIFEEE